MLLTLIADDFEDQISKLRSEMDQQTREAVPGKLNINIGEREFKFSRKYNPNFYGVDCGLL